MFRKFCSLASSTLYNINQISHEGNYFTFSVVILTGIKGFLSSAKLKKRFLSDPFKT